MTGKHKIIVKNNRLYYELEIEEKITIIRGDSATGKTTLIDMIWQAQHYGDSSGIDLISEVPCRALTGENWKLFVENAADTIFFIEDGNAFITTEEFADAVKRSGSYFVLATRENLPHLPYSTDEIYGLRCSGRYRDTKRMYHQLYRFVSTETKACTTI